MDGSTPEACFPEGQVASAWFAVVMRDGRSAVRVYGAVVMPQSVATPVSAVSPAGRSPFARLSALLLTSHEFAHRYLLVMRFVLLNSIALALVGAAWLQGWLDPLVAADRTRLVSLIVFVFLLGNVWCLQRLVATSRELNALKCGIRPAGTKTGEFLRQIEGRDAATRANLAGVLKVKLFSRIVPIRHVANSLVILGLIGTVLGFIIALGGVNPEAASDVSAVGPMISTLIDGMSVALHTTLVGSVLNVWLMINYRLLEGGTVRVLTRAVEMGERDAGA